MIFTRLRSMQTIVVKILNERALEELAELENKKMIKMESPRQEPLKDWSRYVGSLKKTPLADLEKELQLLRDEWE